MDQKGKTFEREFQKLSEAASAMNGASLTLTERIALYREGAEAAKECLALLGKAEMDVDRITADIEAMLQGEPHVEGQTVGETGTGE